MLINRRLIFWGLYWNFTVSQMLNLMNTSKNNTKKLMKLPINHEGLAFMFQGLYSYADIKTNIY